MSKEIKKDNRWKWIIIGFWVVLVIVNIHFVRTALLNKSDLVTEKYYEVGVQFQSNIERQTNFNKYFSGKKLKHNDSHFYFETSDSSLTKLWAHIYYPSDDKKDKYFLMKKESDSLWTSPSLNVSKDIFKVILYGVYNNDSLEKTFEYESSVQSQRIKQQANFIKYFPEEKLKHNGSNFYFETNDSNLTKLWAHLNYPADEKKRQTSITEKRKRQSLEWSTN